MRIIYFTVLFLLITSCTLFEGWGVINKEELSNIWTLSDIKFIGKDNASTSLLDEAINNEKTEKGFTLGFFNDGNGFQLRKGVYKSFKWKLSNEELELTFKTHTTKIPVLDYLKTKTRTTLLLDFKKDGDFEFVLTGNMLSNISNDPFYPENNEWRKKPSRKETKKELHNRVKNYVKHNALILKAASERSADVISFEHSQGVIKIYRSAIGIINYENISPQWYTCFFNKEDAEKGYYIYEEYLSKNKYRGASTGEWVNDDYKILLSIYKEMELASN